MESQKSFGELFGDLKSSFSSDMSLITGALSPLMAIPGVGTALAALKFVFGLFWKGVQAFWKRTLKFQLLGQAQRQKDRRFEPRGHQPLREKRNGRVALGKMHQC